MNKNNTKRKSQRPECGANAPTFLSAVYKRGTQAKKRQAGAPQYGRSLLSLWETVTPRIFERRVQKRYTSEKMSSQCPQNGRSMIEMLGVLAIIGVLSVGGIMGYSKAMTRYKINKIITQITYIAANVRTTFASQGNYDEVGDENIWRKAHILPDDYRREDWSWISAIDNVKKNSADTQYNKAFEIYDDGDPSEEVCIELLTHDWKNAQVKMIQVYSDTVALSSTTNYIIPPAKLDDAVKICDHSEEPTNYDYEFHYYFEIDTSDPIYKNKIDATAAQLAQ